MGDTPARENAYYLMLALDLIENQLRAFEDGGEVAKINLKTLSEKRTRKPKGE